MDSLVSPQFLHNPKASVSTVGYGDDTGIHAKFDDEFVKNEYRSEMEGRAVFDHYFVIELEWPGDNTKTFKYRFSKEKTKNEWTQRFSHQWSAFCESKEQSQEGTPIEVWPPLDKKRVFELKANKISTVEQIAALTDATGPTLGLEWRKMRDQAQAFLNPHASVAQVSKLMREKEDLERRLALLEQNAITPQENAPIKRKRGPNKPKPQILQE